MVLLAGLVFIVVSAVYGTSIFPRLKNGGWYDPNADSTRVMNALHEKLGRDESVLLVLYTSKDGTKADNPQFKEEVEKSLARVQGKEGVGAISSYYNTGSAALVSNDGLSTYAAVGFKGDESAWAETMKTVRPLLKSDRLDVKLGGQPAVSEDLNEQVQKDLERAESLTFPVLAVLLIFIFASLVAASLPLAIGGVSILGAFLLLRITSDYTDISIFAINIITMLGLGLAIDYSLFVVSRFREELLRQRGDVQASLVKTLQTAGRTVLFSGLTVAISLLGLMVFPQMFLKSMGLGGAAAVLVAMLTSVTILPAMLALLGEKVNSLSLSGLVRRVLRIPAGSPRASTKASEGFWYRMSAFVMRHPGKVLIGTLIPLLIVGLPFLQVKLSVADHRSLPEGAESRTVGERLESDFPYNETLPIQVLVRSGEPATSRRAWVRCTTTPASLRRYQACAGWTAW
jgi:RND superfamily putative drug exporter